MTRSRGATISRTLLVATLALASLTSLLWVQPALAADITVAPGDVTGLIAAIDTANEDPGPDVIVLAANSSYSIETPVSNAYGLPWMTSEITIVGNGATITRSDQADEFNILRVSENGNVHISNMTISNGRTPHDAQYGAGISVQVGQLTLVNSTVTGNQTDWNGGGIASEYGGTVTVINSTISGNEAQYSGGGIYSSRGTLTVINSTISGNNGWSALSVSEGSVTLTNTIVAGNTSEQPGVDVVGDVTGSYNLIGDGTGMTGLTDGEAGNVVGTSHEPIDPLLGLLADNGGPTMTRALLSGSPAIDAGTDAVGIPTADQRGIARPQGSAIDIGAFEVDAVTHDELCAMTQQYAERTAVARSACTMLEVARRAELNGMSFVAEMALANYRMQIQSAISRRYVPAALGAELIAWSRTL